MDLNFLDQSSDITPLLVKLYDQQKLYSVAQDNKPIARNALAAGIVELLSHDLSARESEAISDILIELVRQAEKDLKVAVSERLAAVDKVPLRLALQIAHDNIDVAAPLLQSCPVFGDLDLIYIIKSKPAPYWRVIAGRTGMSDQVVNALVDTGDLKTAVNLAENMAITLNDHALSVLSDMAQGQETLAQPLIRRPDVSPTLAKALYEYVGEAFKQQMREENPAFSAMIDEVVENVQAELSGSGVSEADQHLETAQNMAERGLLNMTAMIDGLKRGQYQTFVAQFSVYTGVRMAIVEEVLKQESGQGLAIICRASDLVKPDFLSIYLLSRKTHRAGEAMNAATLNKAATYYDRLTQDVASAILKDSIVSEKN